MISTMLTDEMKKKGLSARAAALQIGVAHTTVIRLLEGSPTDLTTLKKVCTWLSVDVGSVLNTTERSEKSLVDKFSVILQRNPGLRQLFEEYYDKMEHSEISLLELEEMLAFMIFRTYFRQK